MSKRYGRITANMIVRTYSLACLEDLQAQSTLTIDVLYHEERERRVSLVKFTGTAHNEFNGPTDARRAVNNPSRERWYDLLAMHTEWEQLPCPKHGDDCGTEEE